jgi:hypothetical protein
LETYDDKWDMRYDRANAWNPAHFTQENKFLAIAGSCKSSWRYTLEIGLLCGWENLLWR